MGKKKKGPKMVAKGLTKPLRGGKTKALPGGSKSDHRAGKTNIKANYHRNEWDSEFKHLQERMAGRSGGKKKTRSSESAGIQLQPSIFAATRDTKFLKSLDSAEEPQQQSNKQEGQQRTVQQQHQNTFDALADTNGATSGISNQSTSSGMIPSFTLQPASFTLAPPEPLVDLDEATGEALRESRNSTDRLDSQETNTTTACVVGDHELPSSLYSESIVDDEDL